MNATTREGSRGNERLGRPRRRVLPNSEARRTRRMPPTPDAPDAQDAQDAQDAPDTGATACVTRGAEPSAAQGRSPDGHKRNAARQCADAASGPTAISVNGPLRHAIARSAPSTRSDGSGGMPRACCTK